MSVAAAHAQTPLPLDTMHLVELQAQIVQLPAMQGIMSPKTPVSSVKMGSTRLAMVPSA